MRDMRLVLVGLLGASGLVAVGCSSGPDGPSTGGAIGNGGAGSGGIGGGTGTTLTQRPIDSTEATVAVNERMNILIAGLGDATAQLDTTGSTTVATQGVGTAVGSSSGCSKGSDGVFSGSIDTSGLDDFLHQVAKKAKDNVFREELVEVRDGNQVIYKLDPVSACGASRPTCIQKLTANPLRFLVTANTDDSLNVTLLVGNAPVMPGSALLGSTKLSARVDLAKAMDAVRLYLSVEDQKDLPDKLSGVVEGSLEKRGEGDFAISTSLVEKFNLLVGQAKNKPVAVTVLPSSPSSMLTLNSITNTIGYSLNVGAADVQVAGTAVCDDTCGTREETGTFSGHFGGITGAFSTRKAATEITFSGLGLGSDTTQVALNGDPLGTLDVNPSDGRKLSVSFKKTSDGTLITFDPALDIKLAMMLNKLSESLRVDLPSWLEDEIFEVMVGGAAKPSVLVPAPTCDAYGQATSKSELVVVAGNVSLRETSLPSPVVAAPGTCLLPVDGLDSKAAPFSYWRAGTCH